MSTTLAPSAPNVNVDSKATKNVLYVVLHGLICLVDDGDGFFAHILDMKDQHVYMLGNWLLEQPIPERKQGTDPLDLTLQGVNAPSNVSTPVTLNPTLSVVVKLDRAKVPSPKHPKVRAVLRLPRPSAIHYFASGDFSSAVLTGLPKDILLNAPTLLSGIKVFEYEFEDRKGIHLVPTNTNDTSKAFWDCPTPAGVEDMHINVAVLHVYNEPPVTMSEDVAKAHTQEEFNVGLQFLGIQDGQLAGSTGHPDLAKERMPDGMLGGELITLDQRARFVLKILRDERGDTNATNDDDHAGGNGGQVCSTADGQVAPGH